MHLRAALALAALACLPSLAQQPPRHTFVQVILGPNLPNPISGRLLVFARQAAAADSVDVDEFHPSATAVAAMELPSLAPGATVEFDADATAFPTPFSALPAGDYVLQAVLDPAHTYNYSARTPEDWQSPVAAVKSWHPGAGQEPTLTLSAHPAPGPRAAALAKSLAQAKPNELEKVEFESPLLTRFWGRPTFIRAWIVLPPAYDPHAPTTYPTMFWTAGFGATLDSGLSSGIRLRQSMLDRKSPPMIDVMLDESIPQGTHEFADSVNDGPWGTALTTEFLPWIESRYRMDAHRDSRFLNGHSSGGWATLQLQVNYPSIFGGTWSTSPDPSDFHNFTGPDLYAPQANVYRAPDGSARPIMRDKGKVVATLEQFARLETVLGPFGGQLASFDWVFSPRSLSGAPEPMFDRATGNVNPAVVQFWHDHYDLAHLVEVNWSTNGPLLKGRIHLIVGTADTFYLDASAHLFEARLQALGADPHFTYIPGRTHFDLYKIGSDDRGLSTQISREMYAIARPDAQWQPAP